MNSADVFGTRPLHDASGQLHPSLEALHPDLVAVLDRQPALDRRSTGAVRLINGNVECTSCHNPHVQNIDPNNPNFLVIDNSSSALCLACHSTVPTGSGMGLTQRPDGQP